MRLKLVIEDNRFKLPLKKINKMMLRAADTLNANGAIIIIFINDQKMTVLNGQYKGKYLPTDVLAFNLADKPSKSYIEGEIYIDLQMAKRQAREYDLGYFNEIARLCIHGLLHLLGYDDHKPLDKKKMWQLQESFLRGFFDGRQ
jgi:probable rRNA maturation factor